MRTLITPDGVASDALPKSGPPCHHNEPTVLKVLNGRNVYVCSRYPNHHCRACCPADVMLLDDEPINRSSSPQAGLQSVPAPQPFGSPLPYSPMVQSQEDPTGSPFSPENEVDHSKTPRMPSAPTKRSTHHSGATSRSIESGAARSLTPIFNGFAAAANRAQQLGGRFARVRPQAQAIHKMQRQMSGSPSTQGHGSRKRVREERASPSALAASPYGINKTTTNSPAVGSGSFSVQTVSRGGEVRRARGGLYNLLHSQHQQQQQQQTQNQK